MIIVSPRILSTLLITLIFRVDLCNCYISQLKLTGIILNDLLFQQRRESIHNYYTVLLMFSFYYSLALHDFRFESHFAFVRVIFL